MNRRPLGRTGLVVSSLGLGCGPLGDARLSEADAERLVATALEHGIDLFDTAPSYGLSEARLGRILGERGAAATVVTKGGYGVDGTADWTPACVAGGVERALRVLRTERLGVFLLHSCDEATVRRDDLWEPLVKARERGDVAAIGYSGDGPALAAALDRGVVDVVECSVNLVDQDALARIEGRGVGVLAKRVLANGAFEVASATGRADVDEYARRIALSFGSARAISGIGWAELSLRFAAHAPGVSCALVGTSRPERLVDATRAIARGPLAAPVIAELERSYGPHRDQFFGLV